jgi:exopolysaccharide production protein ExoQ
MHSDRMLGTSSRSVALGRSTFPSRSGALLIVPLAACVYALIVTQLILAACPPLDRECIMGTRIENKIFWPAMAAISIVLGIRSFPHLSKLSLPPHIVCFLAYLAFAGASVVWAFDAELSFIRYSQQLMIVTSIMLPAMLARRTADLMRGLYFCFAFATLLNVFFVFGDPVAAAKDATPGYPGYFTGKNLLGQCAGVAFIMALYEMFFLGRRRVFGIIIAAVAVWLLFRSNSKTSLGIALCIPFLAGFVLLVRRLVRISPAMLLWCIPIGYIILTNVSGFSANRISYILYGDSSFTGRTIIWDHAYLQIARHPVFGWGYQSFWLVGPDGPSMMALPAWVRTMPHAHNGYIDAILQLGYIGLALLLSFITATLHGIGRVVDREPLRAWLLLSLVLFIVINNFFESTWMRGFDFMWVVFLIVAADLARSLQRFPARVQHSRRFSLDAPGPGAGRSTSQQRDPV